MGLIDSSEPMPVRAFLSTTRVGTAPDAPILSLAVLTDIGRALYLERNLTRQELLQDGHPADRVDEALSSLLYRHRLVSEGGFEVIQQDGFEALTAVKGADRYLARYLGKLIEMCPFPVIYDVHTLDEPYAWGDLQRILQHPLEETPNDLFYPRPFDIYPLYRFVHNTDPNQFAQRIDDIEVWLKNFDLPRGNALYKALRAKKAFQEVLTTALQARQPGTAAP